VGGLREENVDFRLVAASWPDIEKRVKEGTFLPDLFYRLKFFTVEIPPLRERPEDIEPLVLHFCDKHFQETGIQKKFLSRTLRKLEQLAWRGNVGELDGVIASLLANSEGSTVDDSLLEDIAPNPMASFHVLKARQLDEQRELIESALRSTQGSIRRAAVRVGLKPSSLQSLMEKMKIQSKDFGERSD
jgi:DNA-binding NtrC family response regulator